MLIMVASRIKEQNKEQTSSLLFSYRGKIVPQKGDILDFKNNVPYEVVQVIYTSPDCVVLEVIEYINEKEPVLSSLKFKS